MVVWHNMGWRERISYICFIMALYGDWHCGTLRQNGTVERTSLSEGIVEIEIFE